MGEAVVLGPELRDVVRKGRLARALAQQVDGLGVDDPVEPGAEPRLPPEGRNARKRAREGFLHCVLG